MRCIFTGISLGVSRLRHRALLMPALWRTGLRPFVYSNGRMRYPKPRTFSIWGMDTPASSLALFSFVRSK